MDMEPNITETLNGLEEKINEIYISVERTRKYFMWTLIITVALFVLPIIGLIFAIPYFLSNYLGPIQGLL